LRKEYIKSYLLILFNRSKLTTQMSSQQVVMRSSEDAASGVKIEQNASSGKWKCGKAVITHIW
jgi:hypothetical protein